MADPNPTGSPVAGPTSAVGPAPVDLRRLVVDYYQDVYRYAFRLSGSQVDAEDLTQQTFLVAQQKLHQLREPEKARQWLLAVVRSCFLKSVRQPRPVCVDMLDFRAEDAFEDATQSLGELLAIDREALQQALCDLPGEYRLVVLMYYFEELSYKEIAEQLGIPMGTVMSRLARAKLRLRERLTADTRRMHTANTGPANTGRPRVPIA